MDGDSENHTLQNDPEFVCLFGKEEPSESYQNDRERGTSSSMPHQSSSGLLHYLWSREEETLVDRGAVVGGEGDGAVSAEHSRGFLLSLKHSQTFGSSSYSRAHSSESLIQSDLEGSSNHQTGVFPPPSPSPKTGNQSLCSRSWDGLLCWPETLEGNSITLPCFRELRGIPYDETRTVTRFCEEGGFWQNKTDYSECSPLMQPTTEPPIGTHDVYFAGYCVSLFALTIAMVIFVVFTELRCLRNTIHTNLILTYIMADALWLITSVQSNMGHQTHFSCITFILLHYFHLTNFFWMFVEGLYLYILVVQTFMAENVKFRVYAFVGWGLPLLVVLAWVVAKWWTHIAPAISQKVEMSEGEIFACFWLNVSPYDWIYKLPAVGVLAANSIFLIQIMWVLITKLRSATNPETQQSRKAAKALVVLMPLLGITYVLVLRGSSQTPAYEIIRALLISTQGFLVALLYCFLNGEVRKALRHRWNRLRDMGPAYGCCVERGQMREWSPRSRTESIRLYTPTPTATPSHRKRESTASETTFVTNAAPTTTTNSVGQPLLVTANNPRKLSSTHSTKTYNATDNSLL